MILSISLAAWGSSSGCDYRPPPPFSLLQWGDMGTRVCSSQQCQSQSLLCALGSVPPLDAVGECARFLIPDSRGCLRSRELAGLLHPSLGWVLHSIN